MRELKPEGVTYKIESAVGQGLSSTVYKAIREDSMGFFRQVVALKILRSENAVLWLRREFQTLERVKSPHCVKVLGWENLSEGCALVLEWIDGLSLLELARSSLLDQRLIDEIIAQVQEGLRAVHREGLHHGDLSPGNIIIDGTGLVRILDFGIDPSDVASLHGTPAYMAPELWEGTKTSPASDLFALGVIEHDLKNGFAALPVDHMQARERASRLISQNVPWLKADPAARRFAPLLSYEDSKSALGAVVRAKLMERESQLRTMWISNETPNRFSCDRRNRARFEGDLRRIALLAGVSIFCLTLPGLADAPATRERSAALAELRIRSVHWLRIEINGIEAGYSPLSLKGLKPGRHRLSWQSAHGRGEVRLDLPSGGRILLKEKDLARLRSTGKD